MAHQAVAELETARASDFKKAGWRSVLTRLLASQARALAVMNHQRREAVLITTEEYERLVALAGQAERREEDAMAVLRDEFDRRLQSLRSGDATERMRTFATRPLELTEPIRPGDSH